ncbi:MAG: YbaN family protein [Deltaproteobacteria bacterium]|nr:YbaN family protein [Deltaproteobacteria bacterium]
MQPEPTPLRRGRVLFFVAGWGFFAVGVLGAFLPVLPTTPFMLLALWAFSRSSDRFHAWLWNHPRFGPPLRNWKRHRVVSVPVRATAYVSMLASLLFTAYVRDFHWLIPTATGMLCLVGVIFIARCPTEEPSASGGD